VEFCILSLAAVLGGMEQGRIEEEVHALHICCPICSLADAQSTPSIILNGDQDLLREIRSVCPHFLHSGQFGRHPDNPIFGRVGLEIGLLLGWNAAGGTNSHWSYPPAESMPSTATLDLESYATGGIGG
ncbi:hypothetical protein BDQ94DRAFT_155992, partial [Aspergillus welwitschiae]